VRAIDISKVIDYTDLGGSCFNEESMALLRKRGLLDYEPMSGVEFAPVDLDDNGGDPDGNAWLIAEDRVYADFDAVAKALKELGCEEVEVESIDAGAAYYTIAGALSQTDARWIGYSKDCIIYVEVDP